MGLCHAPGPRLAVSIEGTRSYGVGLARAVTAAGLTVLSAEQPHRKARRSKGKSDPIDAHLVVLAALRSSRLGGLARLASARLPGSMVDAKRAKGFSPCAAVGGVAYSGGDQEAMCGPAGPETIRVDHASQSAVELIAWNAYSELVGTWWASQQHPDIGVSVRTKGGLHRCSAFVCTGSVTTHEQIVMAHNSWDRYASGDTYNVILDITPSHGHRMVMQGAAGYITSNMDWVMTDGGLMITETTIGSAVGFSEDGEPEFQRSRAAAQYSSCITQWRERICKDNNGGYANSWLLGDVNTKEIARLDLGCKNQGFEIKKDGYYAGFNVAEDLRVRNQDCTDPGQYSNILGNGSRRLRWDQLFAQNHGKVDLTLAEAMIADHHDVYRRIDNKPGSRTICGHLELCDDDASLGNHGQGPFYPWGANDGKVTDSDVVSKELGFQARWGNSCGREFNAATFTKEHPQYAWLDGHMKNRPPQPWTHSRWWASADSPSGILTTTRGNPQ